MTEQEAASPPRPGAKVYLDYDQQALDRAYDQRLWAKNAEEIIAWYASASAEARARLRCVRDIPYGESAAERLDLFPAERPDGPVVVYVHGGAWRRLSKEDSAFPAETFVAAGATYIALDFGIIPSVRLPDMVAQVRRGLAWLWTDGDRHGINRDRLFLCGHSSGAHLVSAAMTTDWKRLAGAPNDLVKGALCASGCYDLEPAMLSARGNYLALDDAEVGAYSALRHVERIACPVVVAYGDRESPEFQRQGLALYQRIRDAGRRPVELIVGEDLDHFEISVTLAQEDGLLARAMLSLIGM